MPSRSEEIPALLVLALTAAIIFVCARVGEKLLAMVM